MMRKKAGPNLLFILSDQHRYDAQQRSQPWLQTPHLESLRRDGMSFQHAYCAASPCVPSRASLLTSRWAELHRTWHNFDRLPPPERTWAQALDKSGYHCLAVGRTHHIDRGFETVRVPYGNSYPQIHYTDVHEIPWGERGLLEPSPAPLEDFYEVRVAETAARLLEDLDRNQPFALHVGFVMPHPPYVIPEPYFSRYRPDEIPFASAHAPEPELMPEHRQFCPPEFDEERQRKAAAVYYGMVTLLDACVGRLLRKIDELGLAEETLVIFTSDHGEQLGHRGLWNKGFAYDPSIRVPLLMRWPGRVQAEAEADAFVSLVDLGPTILDALGAPPMPGRNGKSFWEVAAGNATAHRDWIYSATAEGRGAIYRDRRWKFAERFFTDGRRLTELYDITRDPDEMTNLARTTAHEKTLSEIRDRLWQFQRTELNERAAVLYPENQQEPTFNAQFKRGRTDDKNR